MPSERSDGPILFITVSLFMVTVNNFKTVSGNCTTCAVTLSYAIWQVRVIYRRLLALEYWTRDPSCLVYNGYWVFSGNKAAGAWCWPPPSPSAVLRMGRSYTSVSPLWLSSHVVGDLYLYLYLYLLINGHYILEHTDELTPPRFWLSLSVLY